MNRALALALVVGLAAAALSCRPAETKVAIRFRATVGGAPIDCRGPAKSPSGATIVLKDARFFVSNPVLVDADGRRTKATIVDDPPWQAHGAALLDFEDGCENGTPATRTEVVVSAPAGHWNGIELEIGVPFAANHANPATAPPPLEASNLHWSWRGGYKFAQVEGSVDGEPRRLHLGEMGCQGPFQAVTSCNQSNRPLIRIDGFEPATAVAQIDLEPLLGGDCQSEEAAPCRAAFAALGLDFASGRATAPAPAVSKGSP